MDGVGTEPVPWNLVERKYPQMRNRNLSVAIGAGVLAAALAGIGIANASEVGNPNPGKSGTQNCSVPAAPPVGQPGTKFVPPAEPSQDCGPTTGNPAPPVSAGLRP